MLTEYEKLYTRILWFIKYKLAKKNARKVSNQHIKKLAANNILVLCYGNIYRSPFVEYYLKNNISHAEQFNIISAGFFSKSGRHSSKSYIKLVKRYGIDLSDHTSSVVTNETLEWADQIIIMDGKNYKLSMMLNNNVSTKLVWLGSLVSGSTVEIEDPYDKSEVEQIRIVKKMIDASNEYIKLVNN